MRKRCTTRAKKTANKRLARVNAAHAAGKFGGRDLWQFVGMALGAALGGFFAGELFKAEDRKSKFKLVD